MWVSARGRRNYEEDKRAEHIIFAESIGRTMAATAYYVEGKVKGTNAEYWQFVATALVKEIDRLMPMHEVKIVADPNYYYDRTMLKMRKHERLARKAAQPLIDMTIEVPPLREGDAYCHYVLGYDNTYRARKFRVVLRNYFFVAGLSPKADEVIEHLKAVIKKDKRFYQKSY